MFRRSPRSSSCQISRSGTFDLGNGPISDQAFLLTLDGATGAYVDNVTYPNSVIFYAVAYAPDGVPIVSGLHSGPALDIGGTTLPMAAGSGMVARLAP